MANSTIFQKLNKVFSNGVNSATAASYSQNTDNFSNLKPDDVIFSTNSKEEYDYENARLRQQRLLAKQWKRASYEVSNNSLANQTAVDLMYREADMMDMFPEIGAALDIIMEEACHTNPNTGKMIQVTSKSDRIKTVIEDLLYNRLSCNTSLPMVTRSTCKYVIKYNRRKWYYWLETITCI